MQNNLSISRASSSDSSASSGGSSTEPAKPLIGRQVILSLAQQQALEWLIVKTDLKASSDKAKRTHKSERLSKLISIFSKCVRWDIGWR